MEADPDHERVGCQPREVSQQKKEPNMAIQLTVYPTYKGYGRNDRWRRDQAERPLIFDDLEAAKKYLGECYGKCKRRKLYTEYAQGKSVHNGFIFWFRNADLSHYPVDSWLRGTWPASRKSARSTSPPDGPPRRSQ